MRAIWSFWSSPFRANQRPVWASTRHHLLSWVLSFETARRHYPDTALITDDEGEALLVGELGLPFTEVNTTLNRLDNADPAWWALGKLHAYASQTRPFIHIDSDVYLWKPLPENAISAPVFAQNPERFRFGDGWYRPDRWDAVLKTIRGWMPLEWSWYTAQRRGEAACCGVFGGHDTQFIAYYAKNAIRMIEHPRNQTAWRLLRSAATDNILPEQYFLLACLYYHADNPLSPFNNVGMAYVFDSLEAAADPTEAERVGYTHLIAGSKRDPVLVERLEERVRRDYPQSYERVARCCPSALAYRARFD